jgi:hypothetical protein
MSQEAADFVVDNGTGAAVRADLNKILDSILTNNSGSSVPSYAKAYTLWADTGNNVMKIRNAANDGFIELFQLDGTLTLEDGTESLPALAFRDNLNTGIFQSADNKINFSTNGTERLELGTATIFNDGGTDVDFRIEGNSDTNLFNLDAGTDRIGIGNNSPTTKLDVARLGAAWTGDAPIAGTAVTLHNGNNAAGSPAYLGILAGSTSISGIIFGDEINSDAGKIFYEHTDDVLRFNVNVNERARINGSGELYVGSTTSAGQGKLFLNHSATTTTREHIRNASSTGTVETYFNLDDAKYASVGLENGSFVFRNSTSATPTLRMTIDASGNIGAPSGTNIYNASDVRLKKNVVSLEKGLSAINSLRPVAFNWIDGFCDSEKETLYGFIAQEVETVDSNLINQFGSDGIVEVEGVKIEDTLTVNEKFIIPMLVKALQELSAKVAALEAA